MDVQMIPVDAGGRRLALHASGRGWPAVVLETGLGAESREWAAVQDAVAHTTQVVRYDRANRGDSDPAPGPRSIQDAADDLGALVRVAGLSTPCVLVGHSLGGLIVRLYAHQHPGQVAGVVLVDPMQEDQFDLAAPLLPPPAPDEPPGLTGFRAFWGGGWRDPEKNQEHMDLVLSQRQAHAVTTLGDLPLTVLQAGAEQLPVSPAVLEQLRTSRVQGMQRLARQSSQGSLSTVEGSGHFIQRDQPQAVVQAVLAMVQRVREQAGRVPAS